MILTHKVTLDPNPDQEGYFVEAAGTARFVYNWALTEWKIQYAAHKSDPQIPKPSWMRILTLLNSIKREQFPWMLNVSKFVPQEAVHNLGRAFQNFFAGRGRYPKFHRKGVHDSFCAGVENRVFKMDSRCIHLPRVGWVRMREAIRFSGKIKSVTISRIAQRWYASVSIELPDSVHIRREPSVAGVDLGITTLATLSDGTKVSGPKALKRNLTKLKRLHRAVSRKKKNSRNRAKAKAKLARQYARVANIRKDTLHKLTTHLTKVFTHIGTEDLNIRGMLKNRSLARSISDMGLSEFRRQLTYKANLYGSEIVLASRWFPSSKLCSGCGHHNPNLTLSEREWVCTSCGVIHDRDVNAAINLRNLAVSSTVSACGGDVRPGLVPANSGEAGTFQRFMEA